MYSWYPPIYSLYPPNVLNIPRCTQSMISPRCTYDIHLMYSWYPSDILNIPKCTHYIPPMYWTPPTYSWYPSDVLMISSDVLMMSPQCPHGIPRSTEHPRCTEHTLYRVPFEVGWFWSSHSELFRSLLLYVKKIDHPFPSYTFSDPFKSVIFAHFIDL